MTETLTFDVVIVGAGAGGSAAAWAYTKLGYKVCLLERGDWQEPNKYPSNFGDWERQRHSNFSYDPNVRKNQADYEIDNSKSPIRVANFNGVGGSTVLYSGHFPRLHPSDFCTYTLDGVGKDWPITYSDLEPYYQLNDINMGVSGLVGDTAYPDMAANSLRRPIPIGTYGEKIGKAFNELGWHWWPSYSAIASTSKGGRVPCQNVGPCNTGCPTGAKSSVDKTYIPMAMGLGLELITNCRVVDLISERDEIIGVVAMISGESKNILGKITVLACNAIGTARLLMAYEREISKSKKSRLSKQLGKNLMLHPLGYAEALLDTSTDVRYGPQGCSIFSQEFYETDPKHEFKRGYTFHILRGESGVDGVVQGVERRDIKFGPSFMSDYMRTRDRLAFLTIICEDLPKEKNEVYLKSNLDNDGLPVVGIRYELDDNTKQMLSHGLKNAKSLLKKAGGRRVRVAGPVSDAGWHLMGTARMGDDPETSVTSPIGEVHGASRLFVADGSLFVTSGGVNPASTIQALALFVADGSAKKYLGPGSVLNDLT